MISDNMDFVDEFESKLAEYAGSKYAVCTDCCTNAVLISLFLKKSILRISDSVGIPKRTYMSIPMTLKLFGFDVSLEDRDWEEYYSINDATTGESTGVIDAAVFFKEGLWNEIDVPGKLVCLSFQQKKRLSLGRGGAILTDSSYFYSILKRLVYDGRNPRIPDSVEISEHPKDIKLGFHSYMEPDKAARGILALNQPSTLREYKKITSFDYPDLGQIL